MSDFLRALFVWLLGYHITTFFLSQRFNIATNQPTEHGSMLTATNTSPRLHSTLSLSLSPSNGESKWMGK
jgi:hypothetical protein